MYNNQADRIATTAKTIQNVAKKSKSESATHTINATTFITHAMAQNEQLLEGKDYVLQTEGMTLNCELGQDKTARVFVKTIEEKVPVYVELSPALAEEVGAFCYQVSLYPELEEGSSFYNKVKAYDEKGVEIAAQKFNIQNGQMTEVSPTKTQGRAQ